MKDNGKMMSNKVMESSDSQMVRSMKESSIKDNPKEKESININQYNMMTSSNITELGLPPSRMDKARQFIIMGIFTTDNLWEEKDVGLELIGSIKFINTLANGSITASGEKENCTKTSKYSLKAFSKRVWSTGMENLNMKMEIVSRVTISKIKREEKESTTSIKGVF